MSAPSSTDIIHDFGVHRLDQLTVGDEVVAELLLPDKLTVEDATVVAIDTEADTVRLFFERTGITKEFAPPAADIDVLRAFVSTLPGGHAAVKIVLPDADGVVYGWARNERRKQREESLRKRIKSLAEMVEERGANDSTILAELADSVTALQSLKSRIAAYNATGRD